MDACEKANNKAIHKKIVDQIIAVDNFLAFKKLMIKRNTELNQQALLILTKKEVTNVMKTSAAGAMPGQQQPAPVQPLLEGQAVGDD